MSKLPDNITRIDILRVEFGMKKLCTCLNPKYEVDYQNRLVRCTECGAIVDPFEALVQLARNYSRLGDQVEHLLEQRRQIANYQPRRVVLKELEKKYNNRHNLEPTCPRCGEPFELEELLGASWINRDFARGLTQRRKEDEKEGPAPTKHPNHGPDDGKP